MEHHFNVEIAVKYGIAEAILLNNLWYWVKKNEANGTNRFGDEYWTYNSIKAFEKLFPYLTNKQIRTTLKHLVDEGLIKTGNFNKSDYDRTTWYTFTEKGFNLLKSSSCPTGQMELPTGANRVAPQGEPIPNNKHNIKNTDEKTSISSEFERLWELYPRKQGKKAALKHYEKSRKSGSTYEEIEKGLRSYVAFVEAYEKDIQFIKMGSSFFSQEAWRDEWRIDNGRTENDTRRSTPKRPRVERATDRGDYDYAADAAKFPGMVCGISQEE